MTEGGIAQAAPADAAPLVNEKSLVSQRSLAGQLDTGLAALADSKIDPDSYAEVGNHFFKLALLLEFAKMEQNRKGAKPPDVTTDSGSLAAKKAEFLQLLRLNCWEALQRARLLLNEIKCSVFAADLIGEITDHPQRVSIKCNPPRPVEMQPVELSVWFHRPDFERAAAKDELACSWTFQQMQLKGGLDPESRSEEKGWSCWRSFEAKGKWQVTVQFRDASGKVVCGQKVGETNEEKHATLTGDVLVVEDPLKKYSGQQFTIELLQTFILLLLVVGGLMAGAKEKIDQLDPLTAMATLVGIGFIANGVKDLLMPGKTPRT